MDALDLGLEQLIVDGALRRTAVAPRVVRVGRDTQHPAQDGARTIGLLFAHGLERPLGVEPVSSAKQIAAFFRISFIFAKELVLMPKAAQLLLFVCRQPVPAGALFQLGPLDPVRDGLRRGLELPRELLRGAARPHQLDRPCPKLRRVRR